MVRGSLSSVFVPFNPVPFFIYPILWHCCFFSFCFFFLMSVAIARDVARSASLSLMRRRSILRWSGAASFTGRRRANYRFCEMFWQVQKIHLDGKTRRLLSDLQCSSSRLGIGLESVPVVVFGVVDTTLVPNSRLCNGVSCSVRAALTGILTAIVQMFSLYRPTS